MKRIEWFLLAVILFSALFTRLYRFDNPLGDWHSWRQGDTSAVSRNFVQKGYDVFHPRFDDLSNVPSGKDNPHGYRFVEFPVYNLLQAGFFQLVGVFTLEQWGRLVSIFSSLVGTLFLFLLVKKHSNTKLGLLSAFFYALLPYDIYYGRTVLPDTTMVAASLGGIYFFDKALQLERSDNFFSYPYFFLSIFFTACALLLKPYAVFFTMPQFYIAYKSFGFKALKKWQLWLFAACVLMPLLLWRWWMTYFPEGIPANDWLMNGNGIRFRPAFFRWILYERVTKLIAGYTGVLFLLLGLLKVKKLKDPLFFLSFPLASLLYVTVFATGNVQHDYYQILIMPSISIFMGIGAYFLWEERKKFLGVTVGKIFFVLITASMFYLSWQQVKDYFNINDRVIIKAGKAVDMLTPKNAKVMALYDGNTAFLYQTKRQGWASFEKDLPDMIKLGAEYLIIVHPKPQDYDLEKKYKLVSKTDEYILVDLKGQP
ncbi:MAG: glycosyltransferase family 39 protein [Candidatus Levybacteria bacterium]|nr:glycosyltransferase family 39 protein [Candidatus Levybacteria bacterium]